MRGVVLLIYIPYMLGMECAGHFIQCWDASAFGLDVKLPQHSCESSSSFGFGPPLMSRMVIDLLKETKLTKELFMSYEY